MGNYESFLKTRGEKTANEKKNIKEAANLDDTNSPADQTGDDAQNLTDKEANLEQKESGDEDASAKAGADAPTGDRGKDKAKGKKAERA